MKRSLLMALAMLALACGTSACNKAHKAGNDSMSVPGGRVTAFVAIRPGGA